jgi:predicted NBD/HSP70 family sugar kinase
MTAVFDIGGTHTRAAIIRQDITDGQRGTADIFHSVESFETPEDFANGLDMLAKTFEKLEKDATGDAEAPARLDKIIGGMAGVLEDGKVLNSPNLPAWNGKDIRDALNTHFPEAAVDIYNDADLACLGEATYGAGRNYKNVAYMTVSTGIGAGRVVHGAIDRGMFGFEPGHQLVNTIDGPQALENLTSGTAIVKKYGKRFSELDPDAIADIARTLALGIHNTIVHWSPDIFILGGSIILEDNGLFEAVTAELKKFMKIYPRLPAMVLTDLGDENGLYGAASLVSDSGK